MFITIFTPTYNRAYRLSNLYQSLINQTMKDFEWLIVDDGSTDDTELLVSKLKKENKIQIRYIKQLNAGKHIAINNGVNYAQGELFYIVDSDDELVCNSLELIFNKYLIIKDNTEIAGIVGRRISNKGNIIGSKGNYTELIENAIDFRYKTKVVGDMAEVVKTSVFRTFLFPYFNNEKFCPESLIWNRIALSYKMLWLNKPLYIGEYLQDGLTSKIFEIRKQSPEASILYYSELSKMDIPFIQRIKAISNFWRFAIYSNKNLVDKIKMVSIAVSIISIPLAFLLIIKDK